MTQINLPCDGNGSVGVSVSIGAATAHLPVQLDDLLSFADRALYRAKEAGRNRVTVDAVPNVEPGTRRRTDKFAVAA